MLPIKFSVAILVYQGLFDDGVVRKRGPPRYPLIKTWLPRRQWGYPPILGQNPMAYNHLQPWSLSKDLSTTISECDRGCLTWTDRRLVGFSVRLSSAAELCCQLIFKKTKAPNRYVDTEQWQYQNAMTILKHIYIYTLYHCHYIYIIAIIYIYIYINVIIYIYHCIYINITIIIIILLLLLSCIYIYVYITVYSPTFWWKPPLWAKLGRSLC